MAWRAYPLFRHARADGDLRRARRRLRRAHRRRLLRQHAGPCRGDAPRARRAPSGARPDVEAIVAALGPLVAPPAAETGRRPAAPAGAGVSNKAKRRAWSRRPSADTDEPEELRRRRGAHAPLVRLKACRSSRSTRRTRASGSTASSAAAAARRIALSRTRLKALIEAGEVRVDGASRAIPTRLGRARIAFEAPPPEESPLVGEDMPLAVVYEDEHLIVIDKPAGLVVHPAPGHAAGTLVNALIRHCGASLSGIGGVKRPGIVHRLDKDTSGLLVVAKTDAAHRGLAELFADHGRTGSLGARISRARLGRLRRRARARSTAPIGRHPRHRRENGGRRRRARPPRRDALAGRGGPRPGEPGRLPAGDRPDASDPRPYGLDRPSAARRFGLWRGFKTKATRLGDRAAKAALAALGRQALHAAVAGLRASRDRRAAAVREPAAGGFCEVAQSIASQSGGLTCL